VLAGFVETMSTLSLTEVERQRVLTLMTQQTRRMQALVGDLLTLARLEGSARPPADQWVPLARLVPAVEQEARGLSAGRHTITVEVGALEALAGSESELASALGNLAVNAVRYTPDGGRVEIRARRLDDGSGELSVSDSGPGIAPGHLPRLAERFYRVDGSRSRDTGGTGLGLAIVKHVAQRHGGELLIESTLGQGSRFVLRLPPSRVRAAATQAA
jgi:two-component system phosphate regulon sensor histidine kinase PhoR